MKNFHESATILNEKRFSKELGALPEFIKKSALDGLTIHDFEKSLWERMLSLGHEALGLFLSMQGSGDIGETNINKVGFELHRFEKLHSRILKTVFGTFKIARAVYGTREGQKIELAPLDTRLELQESEFSYLFQSFTYSSASVVEK
jgi:hypothetical protein